MLGYNGNFILQKIVFNFSALKQNTTVANSGLFPIILKIISVIPLRCLPKVETDKAKSIDGHIFQKKIISLTLFFPYISIVCVYLLLCSVCCLLIDYSKGAKKGQRKKT